MFDHSESEFWQISLLLNVVIEGASMSVDCIPIAKHSHTVRLANRQQSEEIMQGFKERSRRILDENFVKQEYDRFAAQTLNKYLAAFHGNTLLFRVLNKLCRNTLANRLFTNKSLTAIQNYIECEAHRELVLAGLKFRRKEINSP